MTPDPQVVRIGTGNIDARRGESGSQFVRRLQPAFGQQRPSGGCASRESGPSARRGAARPPRRESARPSARRRSAERPTCRPARSPPSRRRARRPAAWSSRAGEMARLRRGSRPRRSGALPQAIWAGRRRGWKRRVCRRREKSTTRAGPKTGHGCHRPRSRSRRRSRACAWRWRRRPDRAAYAAGRSICRRWRRCRRKPRRECGAREILPPPLRLASGMCQEASTTAIPGAPRRSASQSVETR